MKAVGCDHIAKKTLFPVRSTLVNLRRAVLSSVVGDHMRNYSVAVFFWMFCTCDFANKQADVRSKPSKSSKYSPVGRKEWMGNGDGKEFVSHTNSILQQTDTYRQIHNNQIGESQTFRYQPNKITKAV